MSISLDLDEFCQDCEFFEANVTKCNLYADGKSINDTIVRCEYRGICDRTKQYVNKFFEERFKKYMKEDDHLYEP